MKDQVFIGFQREKLYCGKQITYRVWDKNKSIIEDINTGGWTLTYNTTTTLNNIKFILIYRRYAYLIIKW